ncbi:MAG: transcription elongation factor Spt5 [Candidatus Methanospirareceae archaeon]
MGRIFAVKTTINQERAVADMIESAMKGRAKSEHGVKAILVPDELRGYVLIEAGFPEVIEEMIQGIPHAHGLVKGDMDVEEIEHFLTPKPSVTGITEGSIIEIVSGPFKGERARVKKIDEAHEEITIELFEAMVPIPVTVRGDSVRVLSKEDHEEEE